MVEPQRWHIMGIYIRRELHFLLNEEKTKSQHVCKADEIGQVQTLWTRPWGAISVFCINIGTIRFQMISEANKKYSNYLKPTFFTRKTTFIERTSRLSILSTTREQPAALLNKNISQHQIFNNNFYVMLFIYIVSVFISVHIYMLCCYSQFKYQYYIQLCSYNLYCFLILNYK